MPARGLGVLLLATACSNAAPTDDRVARIVDVLAEDNYAWALRSPSLVAMKLELMQEGPFEWLRGTAGLFWRDAMTPGTGRPSSAFGSPASARVLLVADPHPENLGAFRAGDGTMVVDWNDFDTSGYGPYEGDIRRLAAGLIVAAHAGSNAVDPAELARQVGAGYAEQMAELAAGTPVVAVGVGAEPYLDDLIAKAQKKGDANDTLDELAPVGADGVRALAFGDIDPIDASGVVQKRLEPVDVDDAAWIDGAIAQWRAGISRDAGAVKLRARRFGQGVSSYAALRYDLVLEGPTPSVDDDICLELKEEIEGLLVRGVPELAMSEWPTPAARVVNAQLRMQARPDEDTLLGRAEVAPLSLRVHEETSYQRGTDNVEIGALPPDQLLALGHRFGRMLAAAHGQAVTADGVPGWSVIAPLLGDADGFAGEVSAFATADATQILDDYALMAGTDLPALVLPQVQP